jgi:hypothetical protein
MSKNMEQEAAQLQSLRNGLFERANKAFRSNGHSKGMRGQIAWYYAQQVMLETGH